MTLRCVFGNSCATGDAMVSDVGSYAEDPAHDTVVYLSNDGRLQFRLSGDGARFLWLNLSNGTPHCTPGALHCYLDTYPEGWAQSFGRNGGQAMVVNAGGADVKNGLNSLAMTGSGYGRLVVNWDDPLGRDMRWGLSFRAEDRQLRIYRVTSCTWEIVAEEGAATAVLSAWPKIKRAYTEIPQATFEIPFALTFSTCP